MPIKTHKPVIGLVLVTLLASACSQATVAAQQIQATETTIAAEEPMAYPINTSESETVSQEQPTETAMSVEPTLTEANMEASADSLPVVDTGSVTGDIVTAGSSTVFPLTEAIADRFRDEGYTGKITIDSIGTGAGFERFCVSGETDIANASDCLVQEGIFRDCFQR